MWMQFRRAGMNPKTQMCNLKEEKDERLKRERERENAKNVFQIFCKRSVDWGCATWPAVPWDSLEPTIISYCLIGEACGLQEQRLLFAWEKIE